MPSAIIKSIKKLGAIETYDINTPKYHNFFISNGILSHNSGKSNYSNLVAYKLWKLEKRTTIFLTEKRGDIYANAFAMFKPDAGWQLRDMGLLRMEEDTVPIKLWHPFTFNIPYKQKIPLINFYTHNIKDLTEESLSIILSSTPDNKIVQICNEIKNSLKKDDNILNLLWRLSLESSHKDIKIKEDRIRLPIKTETSKKKYAVTAERMFEPIYTKHNFLQQESHPNNIDWVEVLNDNKQWHFFSKQWLEPDKRMVYLDLLMNLEAIDKALDSGKVKKPVTLVLEEIKALLPNFEQTIYQKALSQKLVDMFQRLRTKAFIIVTMQSIFDTDLRLINTIGAGGGGIMLFKTPINDLKRLIKDFSFSADDQNLLYSLRSYSGEYVFWGAETESEEESSKLSDTKLRSYPTPFKIAEQGEKFFELYERYSPENTKDNLEIYNRFNEEYRKAKEEYDIRYDEWEKREKEKEQEKKKAEQESKKVEELKAKVKEGKGVSKEIQMQRCWEMKQQGKSLRDTAKEIGISHSAVSNFLKEYELKLFKEKQQSSNTQKE